MRKSIWIFLLAVLAPSVVLGWLALRSAEEQKIILERRTAELYQAEADQVAAAARAVIDEQRRAFADLVRRLVAAETPDGLASKFHQRLAESWPRQAIGFAIGKDGRLLSPSPGRAKDDPQLQKFLLENSAFLGGSLAATVYPVPVDELSRPEPMRKMKMNAPIETETAADRPSKEFKRLVTRERSLSEAPAPTAEKKALVKAEILQPPAPTDPAPPAAAGRVSATLPARDAAEAAPAAPAAVELDALSALAEKETRRRESTVRQVSPQQMLELNDRALTSSLWSATTEFRALSAASDEGMVTRFVQDRLDMIFWLRPAQAPELVFGCLIEAASLRDLWQAALPDPRQGSSLSADASQFILALLDDRARPVATIPAGVTGRDWKRPFVASEVGEALPHWEAALYLARPEQLQESARGVRRTLIFLIVTMLGAIALGGWLVVRDARRQLLLAQQKTDFVSNVSHELKTPLTSIRMFAELMQSGRSEALRKAPQYLRIIIVESERLTRLINNVLDFAKLEGRQKRLEKKPIDLHEVIQRIWEGHALHLAEAGFTTRWEAADPPYPVTGDEDALAQILVNLLSNAEKYCGPVKDVALHTYLDGGHVCVSVLDRGTGVPAGEEAKIFEAFYRAHDSLSSGIQGTGLGLTLAQRLAREHDGEIRYDARDGGGSIFTLRLPLRPQ